MTLPQIISEFASLFSGNIELSNLKIKDEIFQNLNLPYIEVSAKSGNNIKKLFDEVIKGAMTKMLINENNENSLNESIRLSFLEKEEKTSKTGLCC